MEQKECDLAYAEVNAISEIEKVEMMENLAMLMCVLTSN